MTVNEFNQCSDAQATELLGKCCHSKTWVAVMCAARPFASIEAMQQQALVIWQKECIEADYLEAFEGHPRIGEKLETLRERFPATETMSANEQSGVTGASDETLAALVKRNTAYYGKFGFIFIVSAAGKSAQEMLDLLNARFDNNNETELANAAAEQAKITALRLQNLLNGQHSTEGIVSTQSVAGSSAASIHSASPHSTSSHAAFPDSIKSKDNQMATLSTHILDTSLGLPAEGVGVKLFQWSGQGWALLTSGATDGDGRIAALQPAAPAAPMAPAAYKLIFETKPYFEAKQMKSFYPLVEITFEVSDDSHYHVPLLLNPFGYSTYRGS